MIHCHLVEEIHLSNKGITLASAEHPLSEKFLLPFKGRVLLLSSLEMFECDLQVKNHSLSGFDGFSEIVYKIILGHCLFQLKHQTNSE